jgi:hypothetical protein
MDEFKKTTGRYGFEEIATVHGARSNYNGYFAVAG